MVKFHCFIFANLKMVCLWWKSQDRRHFFVSLYVLECTWICTWIYLKYLICSLTKCTWGFFSVILSPAKSKATFQLPKSGTLTFTIYSLKWLEINKWYGCDINCHSINLLWFWENIFNFSFFFTVIHELTILEEGSICFSK